MDIDKLKPQGTVYTWNGYTEECGVFSLLRYVETHALRLRAQYLAFTYELGESKLHGKRLVEHFTLKNGLSYWWMSRFVEKHFHHLPLTDAIRLMAFYEILSEKKPQKLLLVSANRHLNQILKDVCYGLNIHYVWQKQKNKSMPWTKTRFYSSLPQTMQAMLTLVRYVRMSRKFKGVATTDFFEGKAVFLCGYFANVDATQAENNSFYSKYWEGLHGLLHELNIKTNWLHHNAGDTYQTAMRWVKGFNHDKELQGFHTFLEAYLSWSIIFKVLKNWTRLNIKYWRLRQIKDVFCVKRSSLSFWPLMKLSYKNDCCGSAAITNLLVIELFDQALRDLPHQRLGLYLCENHAWERALIYAWRKYGHGQLIGVAHTTVRFWDLRYFYDSRMLHALPQPDLIAINGPIAVEAFLQVDFPKQALFECEALRFMHLNQSIGVKAARAVKRILILGDIFSYSTDKMLKLLEAVVSINAFELTFKPHPKCTVNIEEYTRLTLRVRSEPLEKIIYEYDLAFASDSTSAAVDAYCSGLYVIVMSDDHHLNYSPLRGEPGVDFVSTPLALSLRLDDINKHLFLNSMSNKFFFLDPQLPRWRKLLISTYL